MREARGGKIRGMAGEKLSAGGLEPTYWLVAVIDLLGQQDAWLKTDYLPRQDDEAAHEPYVKALQGSLGVVRQMRRSLETLRAAFTKDLPEDDPLQQRLDPEQRARAKRLKQRKVNDYRLSDGIVPR